MSEQIRAEAVEAGLVALRDVMNRVTGPIASDAASEAVIRAALPYLARVVPSVEDVDETVWVMVRQVLIDAPEADADMIASNVTRAVAALLSAAPTVADVREQVSEDILAVAHRYRLAMRPDESQTEFTMRLVRADVLSDAARIARGEKGDE